MALHDSLEHKVIGDFVTACLNHCNEVSSRRNGKVELALFALLEGGVDNDFAVNKTNLNAGDGAIPRNVGNGDSGRNTDCCCNLRAAVGVYRHYGCNNAAIVTHILGEKRTNGTVDTTACKSSLFACSALTTEEGAGETANGIHLLLIVNREGEEIYAFAGFTRCGYGTEYRSVAVGCHNGSVCELSHHTGLKL